MSEKKIILKYGLLIIGLIGGFFLLCKVLGQEGNPYLRFFNLAFVLLGSWMAIRSNIAHNDEITYTKNLGIGIRTAAFAVIISIIAIILYIYFIDPDFLSQMNKSFLVGGDLSLAEISFTLLIEGMASAVIGSFIIMQFYKNHNKDQVKPEDQPI
ncbi:DUF4199 family protein [Polaribacter sp.]|nr:DUF4199 family protein [Polaribacter sp.]